MLLPTTRLDAVNTIIACVGESPVSSLDGVLSADAAIALNVLDEVLREVQSRGWHFNTFKVDLVRDAGGRLPIAPNVVRVETDKSDQPELDLVIRQGVVYDKENATDVFRRDVKGAEVVTMLDFDDIPESARRYVMIRAGRIFSDRMVGSEKTNAFTRNDEMMAWADMRHHESETGGYSIFGHYDAYRPLDRIR